MLSNIVIASKHTDNYFFVIHNGIAALAVDPVDVQQCVDTLKNQNLELKLVVNTHCHWDHTMGNKDISSIFKDIHFAYPAAYANYIEKSTSVKSFYQLQNNQIIIFNHNDIYVTNTPELTDTSCESLSILETPGHTAADISLHDIKNKSIWCGDTIFTGGAGNCLNGGNPHILYNTFRNIYDHLHDDTLIYCGHDYSVRNIEFCLSIEPDSTIAKAMLQKAKNFKRDNGDRAFFLSTIGQEKSYNPFFRWSDSALQHQLAKQHTNAWTTAGKESKDASEQTFITLRLLRNRW